MPVPVFTAVTDVVPELTEEFLVCLGRPDRLPQRDDALVYVAETVTDQVLRELAALDPARMSGGLVVATASREHAARPAETLQAQKLLALLFTKYVYMPALTTRVPDPLGLRPQDTPPEYLHDLDMLRNTPLHLRHSLVDKLEKQQVGLPCLLLLPGPSLALLAPHIKELARRHLTVTISRALPFLRRHGVDPDVLLQLDTVPIQTHFHHPSDRFPESVLLALSMAPIQSFAAHFRRVFFIDSFNLGVLPNKARIRESWLSSLLPCLGCAEALHAPRVLLAGADLRLLGRDVYYNEAAASPEAALPDHHAPLASGPDGTLLLPDAAGKQARTTLQYFATAAEAEFFAQAIQAAQGTAFGNLSDTSLLDPGLFAPTSMETALDAPVLDKSAFLAKADAADADKEEVSLRALRAQYARRLDEARRDRDLMACMRLADREKVTHHPCFRYVAANLPWFRPVNEESRFDLAANLAEELFQAARFARNVATLHLLADKGRPVPVLATAAEEKRLRRLLSLWRPGWNWLFRGIEAMGYEEPMPSGGGLALAAVGDWMLHQEAVILGADCAREFRYALSLMAFDNVVAADALLAFRPLALEEESEAEGGDQARFS
ncbi:6-hydroxymethylpterin diphosphokinase MptE-like protein [Solidesulfovibrio sp.]|uniref:6-hydroxymethylpterin diphosphokinase MptE-like protein n=1 Tax=Solidesulfovibrio sp. TaxID=2910990 RepID=UPI002633947C|nr:6-hydroxymethylpterin diphosphokinase MptE-like protein [Solidesulfovibrio sp.]